LSRFAANARRYGKLKLVRRGSFPANPPHQDEAINGKKHNPHPQIVPQEQWLSERMKLVVHEKELTKHRDRINAERRRLPMVKIEKDYVFDGPGGKQSLKALFDGRTRHHMGANKALRTRLLVGLRDRPMGRSR
jgi:hypothetical protein